MMDTQATFYNPYNYCTSTSDLQPSTAIVNRLPDQLPYTSKHSRGKTFAVHQQYALCRENFRGLQT